MTAMISQLRGFIYLGLLMLSLLGCTDGRRIEPVQDVVTPPPVDTQGIGTSVLKVQRVLFDGGTTRVLAMQRQGNSLYLTGYPFAFMRWDISANAEDPTITFAAKDNITNFAQINKFGPWQVDWYGSGALTLFGSVAYLSGTVGTTVVDISETHVPIVTQKIPVENEDPNLTSPVQDEAFTYKAMVAHPTQPLIYGFRQQDFVYTLQVGAGGSLSLVDKAAYSATGTKCCVKAAAILGNKMYVAFRSSLVSFDVQSNGALTNPVEFNQYQAEYLAVSDNYLYVSHVASNAHPQGLRPSGIYVFDKTGANVALLTMGSEIPKQFAVSQNDTHLYANIDDVQVFIYRIGWGK